MKVLHIFDRYLNSTMNWAHNFIVHMRGVHSYVTAPIVFDSSYTDGVDLLLAPHQKWLPMPRNEWAIPLYYQAIDKGFPGWYNRWLARYVEVNQPDIVHVHFGGVGVRHMDWVHRSKIPFVVSFYGFDMEKLPYRKPIYKDLYRQLGRKADAVFVLGTSSRNTLVANYEMEPRKIHIHPLGVRVSDIPFHIKNKAPGQLKLLQLATITPKKGQLDAVQGLHRALCKYPNIHLTLSGEWWDRSYVSSLQSYISRHHLENNVALLPFTPHRVIFDLMKRHDAFIHPSKYTEDRDSEGGATFAILEAMAAGLPVISTDHRSIPERVIDQEMGFITPEGNPEALAQSIIKMYEMAGDRYQLMSRAARRQVETHYATVVLSERVRQCYRALLS